MKYYITPIAKLARYNIKIIFGNKFMYFILSAVGFYILTVGLNLISDSEITTATGYSMLLVPSILSIFYPTCFGIQNDQDAKIIEIIFGIPNYRYKIWLFRLLIAYMICFIITLLLAAVTDWLVVEVPPPATRFAKYGTCAFHRFTVFYAQYTHPEWQRYGSNDYHYRFIAVRIE